MTIDAGVMALPAAVLSAASPRPRTIDTSAGELKKLGLPPVTQQADLAGKTGQPLSILVTDMVVPDQLEYGLLSGLGNFLRTGLVIEKTALDQAVLEITIDIARKAAAIAANAVVAADIHMSRGMDAGGKKFIRISIIGTAVDLERSAK